MIGVAPAMLAFMFGIHIAMVNLGIGLAWLVPYLKRRADTGEPELEGPARSLMRFYAATYGVAGVFGTAYTVFLLSYYPHFLGLAGHLTLIPFGIAIVMIVLHFFSISAFWYGWDRWSRQAHYLIGALLAISATLIPLGFRGVFAFLNIPAGLSFDPATGKLYLNLSAAIAKNPTFLSLYVKSIGAAVTATFLVVAGVYAYNAARAEGPEAEAYRKVATMSLKAGAVGLAVMVVLGAWYAVSLYHVPYKFNNIFASLGLKAADGKAFYNVSWLFVLKMIFVALQAAAVGYALPKVLCGRFTRGVGNALLVAGILALATIVAGEYLNAFSQYPFFIAIWPDVLRGVVPVSQLAQYGISIPPQVLPKIAAAVNSVVLLDSSSSARHVIEALGLKQQFAPILQEGAVNSIAVTHKVVLITGLFLAGLLVAVGVLFYTLLSRPSRTPQQ